MGPGVSNQDALQVETGHLQGEGCGETPTSKSPFRNDHGTVGRPASLLPLRYRSVWVLRALLVEEALDMDC